MARLKLKRWCADTYSDQEAVQIHGLAATLLPITTTTSTTSTREDLCQAPGVVDPQDVDVVLAAERLDEGEVYLQGHVFDVLVVSCQDAHDHIIRVSVESGRIFFSELLAHKSIAHRFRASASSHLHVEGLGRLVDADRDAALR